MEESVRKETYLAGQLFRQLFEKYNRLENKKNLYKDLKDLTLIEINTIIVIGIHERKSMSEIANQLGVSFGTPTVTIDRLIGKGLVERIRDEEDRRQVFIKLSETGSKVHQSVIEIRKRVTEAIFGILSPEERTSLVSILSKLNNHFDDFFMDMK